MGESSNCILNLSESALNSLKTSDLVQKILFFKFPNFIRKQETYKWAGYHKKCEQQVRGKCKDLQKQGKIHRVFCLGGMVCIKLPENGSAVKLHHISDIPNFPLDLDIWLGVLWTCIYRRISLIFSLRNRLYNFPAKTYCYFSAVVASPLHWSFTANRFYRPGFYFFLFHWLSPFHFDTKMASNKKMWCE